MTAEEAINRGNNLLGTSIVALSGFAFFPEIFAEDEWWHKLDEDFLLLLGIGAIIWYLRGKNRLKRTFIPAGFVIISLIVKIVTVMYLEKGDKADLGDDYGAVILFALSSILIIWIYRKSHRLTT